MFSPAEDSEERPIMESSSGAVMRPPGQQLRLGAMRRGQVDGDVSPSGSLHCHVGLDVLQEVDISMVSHLHLGGSAAAARNTHLVEDY